MKEMKTQLILFSLLLLGSTAWAQQPCLSQDAYREKVEAYSQILKQQKLKTLASSEARKIAHTGFLAIFCKRLYFLHFIRLHIEGIYAVPT